MQVEYWKYSKWRLYQQADYGGNAVNATQKYELIRPILKGEKTPKQTSEEAGIPLSTIYYHLKRFQEGILKIRDRTVSNILKEHSLTAPFFSTNHPNCKT